MYDNSQWDSCKIRSLCEGSKSRSRRERRRRDSRSVSRRRRRWLTPGFTYHSWRLGRDEAKSNAASIKKRDRGWWRRSRTFLRSNSEFGLALWSKIVIWRCLAFAGKQEVRKHYFGDVYQAGPALHLPSGQNSVVCAAFLVPSSGKYKPLHPELFENQRENLKRLALCFETNHDNAMISTLRRWLAPSFLRAATAEHPDFKDALLLVWIGVPGPTWHTCNHRIVILWNTIQVLREEAPGVFSFEMFNMELLGWRDSMIRHANLCMMLPPFCRMCISNG